MRTIRGYEGLYAANEDGSIVSMRTGTVLKPYENTGGYMRVNLYDATGRAKHKYVHRLIAETFLPNPDGLPEVDHKDADRKNNKATNLRWCSRRGNVDAALAMGHWRRPLKIKATNKETEEVRYFSFLKHASIDIFGNDYSLQYCRKMHGDSFEKAGWLFEVVTDGI